MNRSRFIITKHYTVYNLYKYEADVYGFGVKTFIGSKNLTDYNHDENRLVNSLRLMAKEYLKGNVVVDFYLEG